MVELVELFFAAGVFVGPASQPAVSKTAPSAKQFKVIFIFCFTAFNLCHAVFLPSNGPPVRAKFISSDLEMR